ncbi:MAG: FAD-dependent oxidoreductase, partial [Pseudomonadota bacterium]
MSWHFKVGEGNPLPADARYDVLVIGGGFNGLVATATLARAGLRVVLCERGPRLGGAAVAEEFHPGFFAPPPPLAVDRMSRDLVRELGLFGSGLAVSADPVSDTALRPGADPLTLPAGRWDARDGLVGLSPDDAKAFPSFVRERNRLARVWRNVASHRPRHPVETGLATDDIASLTQAYLAPRGRRQPKAALTAFDAFKLASARAFLGRYFSEPALLGMLALRGLLGHGLAPEEPGSAAAWIGAFTGDLAGRDGESVLVAGGVAGLAASLVSVIEDAGGEIITGDG